MGSEAPPLIPRTRGLHFDPHDVQMSSWGQVEERSPGIRSLPALEFCDNQLEGCGGKVVGRGKSDCLPLSSSDF